MTTVRDVTVRSVCQFLQELAPLALAEEWDNVGLLLGDETTGVARVLTCLTLTPDVADEAIQVGARLVVTHHPVLFKPVQKLNASTSEGRMLLKLLRHGIAVYSPHTAYDNAATGINQQLAELLELNDIAPLRPRPAGASGELCKLVTYVPEGQLDAVRRAIWDAGAGAIGNYRECSFNVRGVGTFFGLDDSNPAVGQAGRLEQIDEVRVDVICPASRLDVALAALRAAHPYEVPAIDVHPLRLMPDGTGAGRYGRLAQPLSLGELNRLVAERLGQPHVPFVGDPAHRIETLGIACGAAAEFLRDAHRAGCQALLTGEARFHACLEARDLNMALILPGHYATEQPAMEELARRLVAQFPGMIATASDRECDPVRFE
ncbi:MAG: Nif3-like dinuclear metal center hexameric protein [Planctomycetota bacterium]